MDFILYLIIILIGGFLKMEQTKNVSEDEGIASTSYTVVNNDIPIGDNLGLKREPNAFMLIVNDMERRGLFKC